MRLTISAPRIKHRAPRASDRLPKDKKIIHAIDQQTKTISMPNAFAIAARLKKRLGAHAAIWFERIRGQIGRTQNHGNLGTRNAS
jgi:hypothetical protein